MSTITSNNVFDGSNPAGEVLKKACDSIEINLRRYCGNVDVKHFITGRTMYLSNTKFKISVTAKECKGLSNLEISKFSCRDGFNPYNDEGKRGITLKLFSEKDSKTLDILY